MSIYDVIGSGMTANKQWLEVSSNNIANINTTRTEEGGPYQRQTLVFQQKQTFDDLLNGNTGNGVEVKKIEKDSSDNLVYNPDHADANEEGYVNMPSINLTAEMTDLMMAQRGYQSNVTTFNAAKKAAEKTAEIGRI